VTARMSPLVISILLHSLLVLCFLLIIKWPEKSLRNIEIEVIEISSPSVSSKTLSLLPNQPLPEAPKESVRKVFGASRKSLTTNSPEGVSAKLGNTVAKEEDDLTLQPEDADALPIPVDEILLSRMPSVKTEPKIPYPQEAQKAGVQGRVVLNILIDKDGRVRAAEVISGPGFGLNEAALEGIKRFEFHPAYVGNEAVAVRTRFAYNFFLDAR
jgi:protein TonB